MARVRLLCVEPDDLYRRVLQKMLADGPYELRFSDLADLPAECASFEEEILLMAMDLPGGVSAFDLYPAVRAHRPTVPIVFLTEDSADDELVRLMETEATNVLAKPFTGEEVRFLLDKLVSPHRAFGLKNWLKPGAVVKTFFLNDATIVREHVATILGLADEWGFAFDYDFKIDIVLHELMFNALYHAHGFGAEKVSGKPIVLEQGDYVEIEVGHDENRFGVAITDYRGGLTRRRILESLHRLETQQQQAAAEVPGAFQQHGRGIDIVRKSAGEYYFVIERGRRTQAVIIFDKEFEKDDNASSIRIIEV